MSVPDPSWKKHGPPDPKPTASEHHFGEPSLDLDGVGRSEAERIDGEPLVAVREYYHCRRDGCEGERSKVHLYRVEDVPDEPYRALCGSDTAGIDPVEVLAEQVTIVEHDGEEPFIGFSVAPNKTVGYVGPCETVEGMRGGGECYGHVEPNPDIESYRYDL